MATLAGRVRAYIRGLEVGQGDFAGEPFRVLPWESRFLTGALAPGVQESALTVARGAGKSTLTAAVATAFLDGGGIAAPASEITVVGATLVQSRKVFKHVVRFLEASGRLPRYRKWDGPNRATLESKADGRTLECLGANPGGLHGAAPVLILADEVAQWPRLKVDAMLAALRTGLGKSSGSRMILLGTRPAAEDHPFALSLRTADYVQIHAARPEDPMFRKRTWQRANPSLRYFPSLEMATRKDAVRAKREPSMLAAFKALRLNLGTADVVERVLLDAGTWARAEGEADRSGPCWWGVDLGGSAASSAVAAFWPDSGRLEAVAAFPAVPDLKRRGLHDAVGRLYIEAFKRRELLVMGSRAVPVVGLVREALERFGRPAAIACDRWRDAEMLDALDAASVRCPVEWRGMGFKDGADDVRRFRRAFAEAKVIPVPSLFLASCMAVARTVPDPAGNEKLTKQKQRARDDAAAAAILAVGLASRKASRPRRTWRYGGMAG